MKRCIIAVKNRLNYSSILCRHDELSDVGGVLRGKYSAAKAANELIALGDLNYLDEKNWGYLWNETVPVAHNSLRSLEAYCESVEAEILHVYEDNAWESLTICEPHHYLQSA